MTTYNFDVTWNDLHMGFMEVTGLDRSGILTLKRGVLDRRLWTAWFGGTASSPATSQTLVIRLLDERRRLVGTWTVRNAMPVKVTGPALDATSNDVVIESLELTNDGISRA
jgi:phage tail-like protein